MYLLCFFFGELVAIWLVCAVCSFVYSQQERKPVYEVLLYHDCSPW